MKKVFVKKGELKLVNGGYLSDKDENPVVNGDFIYLQQRAEYIVELAKACKGKKFKQDKVDDFISIKNEVYDRLNNAEKVEFVKSPKEVKTPMQDKLTKEALNFVNFGKDKERVDKINNFLAEFKLLHEFEEYGLFFEEGIVKLNKIYTMKEVIEATEQIIDLVA